MAKTVKVLRVVAKREGFRRAGMEFGAVPKNLPLDTLPSVVQEVLRSDPSLVAFEIDMVIDADGTLRDAQAGDGTDVTLADLQEREKKLQAAQAELNSRVVAVGEREEDVAKRVRTMERREEAVQTREDAVTQREAALATATTTPTPAAESKRAAAAKS